MGRLLLPLHQQLDPPFTAIENYGNLHFEHETTASSSICENDRQATLPERLDEAGYGKIVQSNLRKSPNDSKVGEIVGTVPIFSSIRNEFDPWTTAGRSE